MNARQATAWFSIAAILVVGALVWSRQDIPAIDTSVVAPGKEFQEATTQSEDIQASGLRSVTKEATIAPSAPKRANLPSSGRPAPQAQTPVGTRPMSDKDAEDIADLMVLLESDEFPQAVASRDRNRRFETEPRDEEWAVAMERSLDIGIRSQARLLSGLQVLPPECRQTMCFVAAVDKNANKFTAEHRWQEAIGIVASQPWWQANFKDMNASVKPLSNRILYVNYMERKL